MEISNKLLPKAKLDLENIFQYVAFELVNPESALGLIEKFEAKFKDICKFLKGYPLIINASL
jgi:plasmid stabilization system protein ParE